VVSESKQGRRRGRIFFSIVSPSHCLHTRGGKARGCVYVRWPTGFDECDHCSQVECRIDEWTDGTRKETGWDEMRFKTVYQSHISSLNDFRQHGIDQAQICSNTYEVICSGKHGRCSSYFRIWVMRHLFANVQLRRQKTRWCPTCACQAVTEGSPKTRWTLHIERTYPRTPIRVFKSQESTSSRTTRRNDGA